MTGWLTAIAAETVTPIPTAEPTPTPTASPTPTPESTPTPTPFGLAAFEDPDSCERPSVYRVAFPESWWWNTEYEHEELGHIDACQYFSTQEFDISAASVERPVERDVSVFVEDRLRVAEAPILEVVDRAQGHELDQAAAPLQFSQCSERPC